MPVRVVNMRGVDLNLFEFDYDLTLAVLLMNADGTVYHRYGGRDWTSAMSRQSMPSLLRALSEGLRTHAEYAKAPKPPAARPKRAVEEIPPFAARLEQNPGVDCIHCHMVHDAEREWAQQQKRWDPETIWLYPLPEQAGITLEVEDAALVKGVAAGSAAEAAGLRAGDRLLRVQGRRVATQADVQWELHRAAAGAAALEIGFARGGEERTAALKLPAGWKRQTPLEYSWRPYKWKLRPDPGFGGGDLGAGEKKELGLKPEEFAFRVGYLIDWGDHPEDGRNARQAGVRKGDIVVGAGGLADFRGHEHFQTWFRLTRKPGDACEIVVLRDGVRVALKLPVLP